jgi:hypothetical protein
MWADEDDNPYFYMLGMTRLYGLLVVLLLPVIFGSVALILAIGFTLTHK